MAGTSESGAANSFGMPNRWYSGPGLDAWFCHLMTGSMGDLGFLKTLDVKVRRPVVLVDTV
jgi:hypothetical protein